MSHKNAELFIASRISSDRGGSRTRIMVRIATVTVAVSTAVMIIALAVILGFKKDITDKLVGFGSHVQIVNPEGSNSLEAGPIHRNEYIEEHVPGLPGFRSMNVYALKGGVLKTDKAIQGIALKGFGPDYDWGFFASNLTEGELPVVTDSISNKDILISSSLASLMELGVQDRVEILFTRSDGRPRRDRYKVSGIYDSGFEELDLMIIPTDIRNIRRLNGWSGDMITGYEIDTYYFGRLTDFSLDIFRVAAASGAEDHLIVTDIEDRYPNLFDWLKAHNVNAAVIIIIMILVALLNMISALLIIVLERTKMIGILKSLGMSNSSVRRIFLIRSGYILTGGVIWGNILGLGICLLQEYTGILTLDQAGYFLSEVPVHLEAGWVLLLDLGIFVVLLLLLNLPTMVVSYIKPEITMRYN